MFQTVGHKFIDNEGQGQRLFFGKNSFVSLAPDSNARHRSHFFNVSTELVEIFFHIYRSVRRGWSQMVVHVCHDLNTTGRAAQCLLCFGIGSHSCLQAEYRRHTHHVVLGAMVELAQQYVLCTLSLNQSLHHIAQRFTYECHRNCWFCSRSDRRWCDRLYRRVRRRGGSSGKSCRKIETAEDPPNFSTAIHGSANGQ